MRRKLTVAALLSAIILSTQSAEFLLEPRVVYGESSTVSAISFQPKLVHSSDEKSTSFFNPPRFVVYDENRREMQGSMEKNGDFYFLPLEFIVELFNGRVKVDKLNRRATIVMEDNTEVIVTVSKYEAIKNGQLVPITEQKTTTGNLLTPFTRNDQYYVPYDFFYKVLGIPVQSKVVGTRQVVYIGSRIGQSNQKQQSSLLLSPNKVIRVNGIELDPSEGFLYEFEGNLYAPISIVQKMGDRFEMSTDPKDIYANKYIEQIRQKDNTFVEIVEGDTSVKVNEKYYPLYSAIESETDHPHFATVLLIDEGIFGQGLYLPLSFFQDVLHYPITVQKEEGKQVVYVGAPLSEKPVYDLAYKPPYGWIPPKITSTWTPDKQKNMDILEKELEFKNLGAGARYSPYGKGPGTTAILVSASVDDRYDTMMTFKYWRGDQYTPLANKIPYIARELFKFYFPQKGEKFWKIVDNLYNNKGLDQYIGKKVVIENREVKFMDVNDSLVIIVGNPGVKYDSKWKVIKK